MEKLIRGEELLVRSTGEVRDFIMKIRRGEMNEVGLGLGTMVAFFFFFFLLLLPLMALWPPLIPSYCSVVNVPSKLNMI